MRPVVFVGEKLRNLGIEMMNSSTQRKGFKVAILNLIIDEDASKSGHPP